MGDISEDVVCRVVDSMYQNFYEDITVDDLARRAMFSKFHFTRMFSKVTGVSPARFLAAVRIQEAKRLLVSSTMSITEINHLVGYTSLGTFSMKFRSAVGVTPSEYRACGGYSEFTDADDDPDVLEGVALVNGRVHAPSAARNTLGPIFVGLFPDRVPLGRPRRCTVLHEPGPFVIDAVPPGTWYVLAHSISVDVDRDDFVRAPIDESQGLWVGAYGPCELGVGSWATADLMLHPKRRVDPPVVLALLDIREWALGKDAPHSRRSA